MQEKRILNFGNQNPLMIFALKLLILIETKKHSFFTGIKSFSYKIEIYECLIRNNNFYYQQKRLGQFQ